MAGSGDMTGTETIKVNLLHELKTYRVDVLLL